uniref:U6 snRNA m(6)A methyltransferase n=1 Tax=Steinernema glaseri TaxID=37863 RepID=A0A1I7ZRZ9_9BILA
MHERNPYKKNPPNFTLLARDYPELRKHCFVTPRGTLNLNFNDAEAVRILTLVLLKKDFGLVVELPRNNLVPRIPQRLNYLLFIEDLLMHNAVNNEDVFGIDIGTGASCIYPLLGAKKFGWKFLATEIDEDSASIAMSNVKSNNLSEKITVIRSSDGKMIFPEAVGAGDEEVYTFSMCNPPFYDFEESDKKYAADENDVYENVVTEGERPGPRSATVAKLNELATEGGEVAFVLRMVEESKKLRARIRVYTSMVGIKTSMYKIERVLKEIAEIRYMVSTLNQGRTQRFVIAWTYDNAVKFL